VKSGAGFQTSAAAKALHASAKVPNKAINRFMFFLSWFR